MAGHSQFKNIMHRKGAQDKKRAKMFNKLSREITVSTKQGLPDPAMNPRLRAAMMAARAANMPKDRIDKAIAVAVGGTDNADYVEIRYEAYGPAGVAIIIEALTDNRNRTAAELRGALTKYGGALGETNSVAFMFNRVGQIIYPRDVATDDAMFDAAVAAGADNVTSDDDGHVIVSAVDDFAALRDALDALFGPAQQAGLVWQPTMTSAPDAEATKKLLQLLDVLDDNDDIQQVFANFDVADDVLAGLSAE